MIYFIRAGLAGPVKIGYTRNLRRRFDTLQGHNPELLYILRTMDGGPKQERWLHTVFQAQRIRGEWFTFSEMMLTIGHPTSRQGFASMAEVLKLFAPHETMAGTP